MSLREKFDAANTTADGHLTREQAEAAGMTQVVANFEKIDAAGVGHVTFDQVKAFKGGKKAGVVKARKAKMATTQRRAKAA